MVLQSELAEDEEDVTAPLGVVGGLEIKNDGNQVLHVLDNGGQAVQMSNGRGFGGDEAVIVIMRVVVPEGVRAKTITEGSDLLFEGVSLRALLVKSVSGSTNAFLGSGGGLEEVSLLLELLTALGVGGAQGGGLLFQCLGGGEGFVAEFGRGGSSRYVGAGVAGVGRGSRRGHWRGSRRGERDSR
jgi:hypothetical protein